VFIVFYLDLILQLFVLWVSEISNALIVIYDARKNFKILNACPFYRFYDFCLSFSKKNMGVGG
jgi:hypothetical protein